MMLETERYLAKSEKCLAGARATLAVHLTNDAGRNAYLAAYHAAQALIFERTGKSAKTHKGVHTEFSRLIMGVQELDGLLLCTLQKKAGVQATLVRAASVKSSAR